MSLFEIAQIVSIVTVLASVVGVLQKEKYKSMIWFTVVNLAMIATYILLGRTLGAILVVGATVRTFVYFLYAKFNKPVPALIFAFFEVYFAIVSIIMFKDYVDLFMIANLALVTYTTWQDNMRVFRVGYILSSVFLITYDVLSGAYVSIISEVIMLVSTAISIYKYDIKSNIKDIITDFYGTIAFSYDMTLTDKDKYTLIYSGQVHDVYNNFAYFPSPIGFEEKIEEIQSSMKDIKRKPCAYFQSVNNENIHYIINQTKTHKLLFHDVWMKLISGYNTKSKKCLLENVTFRRCNEKDKDEIVDVFTRGFINSTGEYADIYKYEEAYAEKYRKYLDDKYINEHKLYPYMAFLDGKAVALLFVYRHNYLGYICQITTLTEYRRKGIASALMQFAINQERRSGVEDFYLVTEKYTWLENFYMKNNFREVSQGFCIDLSTSKGKEKKKKD